MIARKQKTHILETLIQQTMRGGRFPQLRDLLPAVRNFLSGRRFGAPLVKIRFAEPGQPIGGPKGNDIQLTLSELKDDLSLLYEALIDLASRNIDLYDIFSTRRDRLSLKLGQLRTQISTLLAQQGAGSRDSVTDSFNTTDFIDTALTTARVELDEGIVTLPPDNQNSVRYDGTKAKVVKKILPAKGSEVGPPVDVIFDPFRLNAWYASIPVGSEYVFHVNVTGTDYQTGSNEEVAVNAIRIEPTGPMHVIVDWSPDGYNWHSLNPEAIRTIRDKQTFHFNPVNLGFLRFRLSHSEEIAASAAGQVRPIGIKRIEILSRGFSSAAQLFSTEFRFAETVHTVTPEIEADIPFGTRIVPYIAQAAEGPWIPLAGGPVTFDTQVWTDLPIVQPAPEQEDVASTMWRVPVPDALQPLPNTGDLVAGRGQVQIAGYPFDWRQMGDRAHIPTQEDWSRPLGEIRTRTFRPIGLIGTADVGAATFIDEKNPLAVDETTSNSFMVLGIIGGDGRFVLQPGYNYRLRTYAWCPAPTTLESQRIGVVNTGGTSLTVVAPVAMFVNGRKVFQQDKSTTSIAGLADAKYQATIGLQQGFNQIELLLQIPADLVAGQGGVASSGVYLYVQPDLFSSNLADDLGVEYIQAYQEPWKRYTEFDLRYNVPPGKRDAWAWDYTFSTDADAGKVEYVLFNHDPSNDSGSDLPQSTQTIDGQNAGEPVDLFVRYPTERNTDTEQRSVYFRADLSQDTGASVPPVLRSYRLIIN